MTDHTIRIAIMRVLGYNDKLPVWDVAPVQGRYYVTPPTLTDEAFGEALMDVNGRLIVKAIIDSITSGTTFDVSDRAARKLGYIYGHLDQILKQKATTYELLTYDSYLATLLGGGLPAALDGLSLKVKEQSPITSINVGNYPASYLVTASDLDIRDLTTTERTPLGSEGVALKQIATSNELSVKESTPLTGFATSTLQTTGNNSLGTIKTNTDPLVASAAGGYVRQDSTGTIAKEAGGNLATVKTNTDPLVTAAAAGYVRPGTDATWDVLDRAARLLGVVDTELPAAGALGDLLDNPTTPLIGACRLGWTGAKWERMLSAGGVPYSDVTSVGGTNQTGRDLSLDLRHTEPLYADYYNLMQGRRFYDDNWYTASINNGSSVYVGVLVNPVDSGKNLILEYLNIQSTILTATSYVLVSLDGTWTAGTGSASTPANMRAGGAASAMTDRTGITVTAQGSIAYGMRFATANPNIFPVGVCVPPNHNLLVQYVNQSGSSAIGAAKPFWREEDA